MLLVLVTGAGLLLLAGAVAVARRTGPATARWLRWAALAAALVAAVVLAAAVASDAGWFAIVLVGVPVALAALPVGWERLTGRDVAAVNWGAAVLALGWAVLLALGVGLALIPAALLQLAAAAAATAARGPVQREPAD